VNCLVPFLLPYQLPASRFRLPALRLQQVMLEAGGW